MTAARLAIRRTPGNDNHHLWNNHGTWWCHYTLHTADYQKVRVRRSLGTAELAQARSRRDALLAGGCAPANRAANERVTEASARRN